MRTWRQAVRTVRAVRTPPIGRTRAARWRQPLASGARHRVDLRGALGEVALRPALAAVLAGEDFTDGGRAVHALGLSRIEGDGEHRGLGLDAHVDLGPARAAVSAAEQRAHVALEIGARGQPDGLGIAGDLADVAAVRLPLDVQRLDPGARPVLAPVGAAEQTGAADR